MSNTVIKIENVSKQYQLGQISTGSLAHDINRWWHTFRGKEDPYLKIGDVNDRAKVGSSEYVWALKDVSFEVKQGEVLGVIGRNGAGKSTLLKILSRTTLPTTGSIKAKGRIASLLEVGTGFHPELSGRENIFLNGTILGMSKKEILRKFDEIVDFSGVEKYIDTPVKRYSSGMYVRLAFAVAAHLEPEILIVDEVLAVGDAEFQKKCLGKMKDVSVNQGRTVLFVSHNITAINSLCTSGIYLRNGMIEDFGSIDQVISSYLNSAQDVTTRRSWKSAHRPGDDAVILHSARVTDTEGHDIEAIDFYKGGGLEFVYEVLKSGFKPIPNVHLFTQKGDYVLISGEESKVIDLESTGCYKTTMKIPAVFLNEDRYIVGFAASTLLPERIHFYEKEVLVFDVIEDMNLRDTDYRGPIPGVIRPKLDWQTERMNDLIK